MTPAALRVVVVEEHDLLRGEIIRRLRLGGCTVAGAGRAGDLPLLLSQSAPDAVVLGDGPATDEGFRLARRLRRTMPSLGILMLTARNDEADRVRGYQSGADVCLWCGALG